MSEDQYQPDMRRSGWYADYKLAGDTGETGSGGDILSFAEMRAGRSMEPMEPMGSIELVLQETGVVQSFPRYRSAMEYATLPREYMLEDGLPYSTYSPRHFMARYGMMVERVPGWRRIRLGVWKTTVWEMAHAAERRRQARQMGIFCQRMLARRRVTNSAQRSRGGLEEVLHLLSLGVPGAILEQSNN